MSRLLLALALFPFALGAATTPTPAARPCCRTKTPCCSDTCCKVADNCCKKEPKGLCAHDCPEDPAVKTS